MWFFHLFVVVLHVLVVDMCVCSCFVYMFVVTSYVLMVFLLTFQCSRNVEVFKSLCAFCTCADKMVISERLLG